MLFCTVMLVEMEVLFAQLHLIYVETFFHTSLDLIGGTFVYVSFKPMSVELSVNS
jgi:hypothetical protein